MLTALDAPGNILVEAVISNPNSEPNQYWSHGFQLKDGGSNKEYWAGFKSTGVWRHFYRLGDSQQKDNREIKSPDIDISSGASNLLQVVQADGVGWVYINGVYQGSFAMDADTGGDQVKIYVSDKEPGTTRFEDFTVWRWNPVMYRDFPEVDPSHVPPPTATPNPKVPVFGPDDGLIVHEPGDGRQERYRGPRVAGDVIVEVTVEVPFAPNKSHWNFGIQFDSDQPDAFHIIRISSKFGGALNHWRKSGPDSEWQGRRAEDLVGLNFEKGEKNHLRLIVVGDHGWVYVNHRKAGTVNFSLGDIPNPDRINLLVNDEPRQGYDYSEEPFTEFEDFTVWRWHESLFELPDDD